MFDFLRAIGLKPLEWSQAIAATGEATPYVGQVLDNAFSSAQAVVVLLTPDDEAWLRKEFQTEHDEQFEKQPTGQARPNVLFEAGMAMGRDAKRTVLVQIGNLRPFSDVGGRHVLRLDNSSERRQDLADRLKTAGCLVDLTGRDWHKAGSFTLETPKAAFPEKADTDLEQLRQPPRFLPAESEKMLVQFANAPKGLTPEQAADGLGLSKARIDYHFDHLKKHNFVHLLGMVGSPIRYSTTPDGREYLANAKLL